MGPKILTQRLVLRPIQLEDITEEYLRWLNDPAINSFLEIRHQKQDMQSLIEYNRKRLQNPDIGLHLGVFDADGKRHVGNVTFNQVNFIYRTVNISFLIGLPEVQKNGYATEAVGAACAYMFRKAEFYKICGGHYASHTGSFGVFQKLGFKVEGVRRGQVVTVTGERDDLVLHGLMASEFDQQIFKTVTWS